MDELIDMLSHREEAVERLVKIDRIGEVVANLLLDGISNRKESIIDLHSKIVIVEAK